MTREVLNKLHKLCEQIKESKELSSELLKTAQDRHNMRTHKLMRDGKEVELIEKVLWDEVFYLGPKCQAGEILGKHHPEVFKAYKAQDQVADELRKFCITELGMDYSGMTISDYLRLTEFMFELLLKEKTEIGQVVHKPWWKRLF